MSAILVGADRDLACASLPANRSSTHRYSMSYSRCQRDPTCISSIHYLPLTRGLPTVLFCFLLAGPVKCLAATAPWCRPPTKHDHEPTHINNNLIRACPRMPAPNHTSDATLDEEDPIAVPLRRLGKVRLMTRASRALGREKSRKVSSRNAQQLVSGL